MARNGLAETNPLRWTSKYGSVIITAYDVGTADGINEKGLAGHLLYLPETSVGDRDETVPGLSMSMWVQYYLDQFATVKEAVKSFESRPFQLRMAVEPSSGGTWNSTADSVAINDCPARMNQPIGSSAGRIMSRICRSRRRIGKPSQP